MAMASSSAEPEPPQQHCDTELSLGRRPATPPRVVIAAEGKAGAAPCGVGGATELQAAAILRAARNAVAVAEGQGPPSDGLSMKRSLEWFLRRRRRDGAHSSASSSSCSTCSS